MTQEMKNIYVTVKTFPAVSKKYSETVCTAGVLEDGSWIRLYPVPFRILETYQKYHKYNWIKALVERNIHDRRLESYKIVDRSQISILSNNIKFTWEEKRKIIFNNNEIYTNLSKLIKLAKEKDKSLAIFKPTKIHRFKSEEQSSELDPQVMAALEKEYKQNKLFDKPNDRKIYLKPLTPPPYNFSYTFEDDFGQKSTMIITDWEVSALYNNCYKKAIIKSKGSEKEAKEDAKEKVCQKYTDFIEKNDLYFFLGTTSKFHYIAPNPFIIIGIFYPPKVCHIEEKGLFDSI
jgi:hypothetical protein